MDGTGTIVFMFLLDHLPENILNKTLETIEVTHTEYSNEFSCDYAITDPLLQIISRELEVLVRPKWLTNQKLNSTNENVNERLLTDIETNEVLENFIELNEDDKNSNKVQELHKNEDLYGNEVALTEFSRQVPMLAAIFESLSNITAQTCAGTVIGPRWVLTEASCINLLSDLNAMSTHVKEPSVYTVVLNATDPLVDGSAHNVTEVHLRHNGTHSTHSKIALMKIDPPVVTEYVSLVASLDVKDVTVYGWTTRMDDRHHDSMEQTALRAVILSHKDCATHYNLRGVDASEMCFATTDEYDVAQMSWGGPVVSRTGGILAVTRGESPAPLAAWPLADHIPWIHSIINK